MGIDGIGKNGPPVPAPEVGGLTGAPVGPAFRVPRRHGAVVCRVAAPRARRRAAGQSTGAVAAAQGARSSGSARETSTWRLRRCQGPRGDGAPFGACPRRAREDPERAARAAVERPHARRPAPHGHGRGPPARRRLTWRLSWAAARWCWGSPRPLRARAAKGSPAGDLRPCPSLVQRAASCSGTSAPQPWGPGRVAVRRAHLGRRPTTLSRGRRPSRARRGGEVARRGRDGLASRLRHGPRLRPPARAPSARGRLRGARRSRAHGGDERVARRRPFGGLIVACPWLPDVRPASTADVTPLARFLLDVLLPRVRRETPALAPPRRPASTGCRSAA